MAGILPLTLLGSLQSSPKLPVAFKGLLRGRKVDRRDWRRKGREGKKWEGWIDEGDGREGKCEDGKEGDVKGTEVWSLQLLNCT